MEIKGNSHSALVLGRKQGIVGTEKKEDCLMESNCHFSRVLPCRNDSHRVVIHFFFLENLDIGKLI